MSQNVALIVVDMLNRYEHEDAEILKESVREALPAIRHAIEWAQQHEVPIVYVNDNYGEWGAGAPELCEQALQGADRALIEPVLPPAGSAFVAKARHSIFYETPLDYLLRSKGIERLLLVGQVTEQCILYSALDGHVRHYEVTVLRDAVAHIHPDLARAALEMMECNMRAEIVEVASLLTSA
jgi:nicotinamidase-related amidase